MSPSSCLHPAHRRQMFRAHPPQLCMLPMQLGCSDHRACKGSWPSRNVPSWVVTYTPPGCSSRSLPCSFLGYSQALQGTGTIGAYQSDDHRESARTDPATPVQHPAFVTQLGITQGETASLGNCWGPLCLSRQCRNTLRHLPGVPWALPPARS